MFTKKAKCEILLIAMLAVMGQMVYVLFYSDSGYRQLQARRSELEKLEIQHRQLLQEQQNYRDRIERLTHDDFMIEHYARERYKLARRGDVIVNIEKKK